LLYNILLENQLLNRCIN